MGFGRFENNSGGPDVRFLKSRGATIGANTIVQDGDFLGRFRFQGADGIDFNTTGAQIHAEVDGTPGGNDLPSRLVFSTTADGDSSVTEQMTILQSGNVGFGASNPTYPVEISQAKPQIAGTNASGRELWHQWANSVDNIYYLFAAYIDDGVTIRSSDVGSNFAIVKNGDALTFRSATGVAVDDPISFKIAFTITKDGDVEHGPLNIKGTDGRISGEFTSGAAPFWDLFGTTADNMYWNLGAYWNGSAFISADAGSNFAINKNNDQLKISWMLDLLKYHQKQCQKNQHPLILH